MTEPAHHVIDTAHDGPLGQRWPVDQNDRQMQRPGRVQFGAGTVAACVLGDHMRDAMRREQHQVTRHLERPATNDDSRIRQRQRRGRPVDEAQQKKMLRLVCKGLEVAAADGEKNTGGFDRQRCDGGRDIWNRAPVVAGTREPGRALVANERNSSVCAGCDRIAAHLSCEGMRRVDDVRYAFAGEILDEAVDAAESACANGQRLRYRRGGAARIGIDGIDTSRGQRASNLPGFRRAAEKEDAQHG